MSSSIETERKLRNLESVETKFFSRPLIGRHVLAMVGMQNINDISESLAKFEHFKNPESAYNPVYLFLRQVNAITLREWGSPFIVKDEAKDVLVWNENFALEALYLQIIMLPIDLSAVGEGLDVFGNQTYRESVGFSPEIVNPIHSRPNGRKISKKPTLESPELVDEKGREERIESLYSYILYGEDIGFDIASFPSDGVEALRKAEEYGISFETAHKRRNEIRMILGLPTFDTYEEIPYEQPVKLRRVSPVPLLVFAEPKSMEVTIDEDNWRKFAACRGRDDLDFVPPKGHTKRVAKKLCTVCPVVDNCLDFALKFPELKGYWAGTSEKQRDKLRKIGYTV